MLITAFIRRLFCLSWFLISASWLYGQPLDTLKILKENPDTIHLIVYYPHYHEAAKKMKEMCNEKWNVKTLAISCEDVATKSEDEVDHYGSSKLSFPVNGEIETWAQIWDQKKIADRLLYIDPRAISYTLGELNRTSSIEYITLLGNQMELPPSSVFHTVESEEPKQTWMIGTDHFYGCEMSSGVLTSLVPKVAVSRIPVLTRTYHDQVVPLTVNDEKSLSGVLHVSADANGELLASGGNFSLSLALGESEGRIGSHFYQPIKDMSGKIDGSHEFKIVITKAVDDENMTKPGHDNFTLADSTVFPYLIQRVGKGGVRGQISDLDGDFGLYKGDLLVDALRVMTYGDASLVIAEDQYKPTVVDDIFRVRSAGEAADGGITLNVLNEFIGFTDYNINVDDQLNDDYASVSALEAAVDSGNSSFYIDSGDEIYAVTGMDIDAGGNIDLTISGDVGDNLPDDPLDFSGESFVLRDGTLMRNRLNALMVDKVRYILPAEFMDDVDSTAYAVNLTASANAVVDKLVNWNDYMQNEGEDWFNTPHDGLFHKALVFAGSSTEHLWNYSDEQIIADYMDFQDPTDEGLVSLFDGYHITKVFESNPGGQGNLKLDHPNDDHLILSELSQNGLLVIPDNWDGSISRDDHYNGRGWSSFDPSGNTTPSDNSIIPNSGGTVGFSDMVTAGEISTSENLSLMMSADHGGHDLIVSNHFGVLRERVPIPQQLLFEPEMSAGQRLGLMGYIGNIRMFSKNVGEGSWLNGRFNPTDENGYMLPKDVLLREALVQYSTSKQPRLGSVYREGLLGFIKKIQERRSDEVLSQDQVLENHLTDVLSWGAMGISAQPLPPHRRFKPDGRLSGDVPQPRIDIISNQMRKEIYDRYSTPVLEIPSSGTGEVTVTLENMFDIKDENGNLTERGLHDYDPDMLCKVTLVSVPLGKKFINGTDDFLHTHRISELDFEDDVPTNNDISWVRYKKLKEISSDNVLLKYTFSGNWGMNGSVLTRGPGMYMLKVEAKERDRNDDGLVDEQKIGSYTKEARMFFKVVNEFEEDPDTLFLLVNNTDKDPYLQRYAMRGSITGYTLPSTAIRYYEDVLDNYQYTRGKASIDISSKKISEDDPDSSFWKHRVFVGDKIRINNEEGVLSPWLRVVSKETDDSSSVTSLTVDGNVSLFTGDKTGMDYVVARAYTPGYSEVYYSYNGFSEGPPQFVASANLFIPKNQLQSGGQLVVIIKKGDYFKFLDSRDFVEIDSVSISPNVNADDNWVVTLELVEPISHDSLWHYHSHAIFMNGDGNLQYPDKPNPEMESRIRNTTSGKISGSYAIYPKNGDAPNRLYKTWNVHNYNTSNREGQGVHGDLTTGILESYSVGDESNRHHKVVIFANDASYDGGVSINSQFTRDRDNDGTAGTEVHIGDPSYFTSEKDARLFSNFLGAGGRLLTGGQFDRVDGDSSFYQLLGLESSEAPASSVPTSVIRVDNDPISNAFNAGASINIGAREGANDTIDAEALNTNVDPKGLMLQGGLALPMLEYTGIGASANSSIAATRVSGGTDDKIHAAVYLGFDFATMSQSGIKSELTDKTDSNDTEAGRNLLLKKSIDWLRDPSLTPKDRRAELTYIAEDIDGNTTIIALGNGGAIVNDSLHSENNLSSGVGPAMELTFVASGGKLYSNNPYIWSGVGLGIRRDAQVSDNEDMHRVIVTTGTDINDVYELVLDAPDGSRTIVEIQVRKQEMTCTVLPLENEVINQSTVFSAGKEVTLYTFGGLGKGSFEYSISSISEPWIRGVLEKKADGTAIYKLPQWPEDEKQTTVVNFLVQSFDQYDNLFDETDASLTIYPPLKLDISEEELVDGTGGLIIASPKGGYSSGYDFTSSPADLVTLSLDEESDDTQVSMAPSPVLSNDLKSPTTVTITASDMTFVNESALRNIKLFPGPSLDYKVSTASSGFFDLQENSSFGDLSGNALTLSLMGGNGTMTVELLEVSEGFKTTKDAYNGELIVTNSDNVITSGENITEGQSLELNNLDGAYISIFPGEIPGSITLRTSSKGSSNTFVINFDTSIKVEHTKADGTATDEVIGDSQTVYLRARNDDQLTAKNSMMSIGVREQVGLIEWTYSGVTGGFVSSANYISYQSSTNINVGEPIFSANMIQHSPSDNVYFVAPRTTGAATLTATIGAGDDQLTKTINFQFTATDPMNWVQHPDSEDATSLNPLQPVTFEFSQGEGPFSVSLQGFGAEVTVSSGQLNGSSIVIASGSQQMFTLNPNGSESTGTVKVTDNSGLTLVSSVLTFKSDPGSSPSPNPGLPPGPSYSGTPNTTASPSAGGGGGGCLLR